MIAPRDLAYFGLFDLVHQTSEVSARRAISGAYYAVFLAVATAGSELFTGPPELRQSLARSYEHRAVQTMAEDVLKRSKVETLPHEIVRVARALKGLHEARRDADYDLWKTISWEEANERIWEALEACQSVDEIKTNPVVAEFLLRPLLRDGKRGG